MEMSVGEVIDRLSILFHKVDKIGAECLPEYYSYSKDLLLNIPAKHLTEVIAGLRELHKINGLIWALEADIRKGKEGEMGLEEVGRRALQIRDFNGQRVAIKNDVAKLLGQFGDIKTDHASSSGQEF
jgi:hypothetical protein